MPLVILGIILLTLLFINGSQVKGLNLKMAVSGTRFNIVIIFTDDREYKDLGCFGANGFSTPNLYRLADEGIRLTSFYAGQPLCCASATALLTGSYP